MIRALAQTRGVGWGQATKSRNRLARIPKLVSIRVPFKPLGIPPDRFSVGRIRYAFRELAYSVRNLFARFVQALHEPDPGLSLVPGGQTRRTCTSTQIRTLSEGCCSDLISKRTRRGAPSPTGALLTS